MKLSPTLNLFNQLFMAFQIAFWPTLISIWRSPLLLFQPQKLSQTYMAHVWLNFGNGADEGGRPTKERLITPHATGVVLDLGAGYGHTIKYVDRSKVTKYVAVEPNLRMHNILRATAATFGFTEADKTLLILSCGAEDTSVILSALNNTQVDTIISVLTFCSISEPQETIAKLVLDVLKPGGQLTYYEHVLSSLKDVAWWQHFWAPLWAVGFDGCRMDRPTHLYIEEITDRNGKSPWKDRLICGRDDEPEEDLFWHRAGRCTRSVPTFAQLEFLLTS
ncbi:hypothetical protein P691DRAFT_789408 [Macrolepiota fuliginosa MF-IS2]|uniref:S-adenosyl-L-methionine-dependent methyltransferase n=1 Tax=Macrolepiota fuliginosa MF-IS2 TaxID=1400762 RepID=A0A9P5X0Y5_9AGAR|nr:hypothetical protein P691DRAFT_789408 [Macrolepiota fuliginosa MF-IS2]